MTTYQTRFLNEVEAGHDGPQIPSAKLAYLTERARGIMFEYIIEKFLGQQINGLTKAKLARRIGKAPEVINRLLGTPSNMTIDTVSELLIGIGGEELVPNSKSLLNRSPVNYSHATHLEELLGSANQPKASAKDQMFPGNEMIAGGNDNYQTNTAVANARN